MKGDRTGPGWRAWLILGLVAYGVFTVALLPAALLWDQVRDRGWLPADLAVAGIEGTVWGGSAAQITLPNGLSVSDLQWRLRTRALAGIRLEWEVQARAAGGQTVGRIALVPSGLRISGLRADLDAASVITPVPLVISGRLLLDVERFTLTRAGSVGDVQGIVGWLDAGAGLPDAAPLGSLRAELGATQDGALRLEVRDQGGPLLAEGSVVVDTAGRYRVEGHAGARSDADPRLAQALRMLGTPDRDGRTPVRLSGSL